MTVSSTMSGAAAIPQSRFRASLSLRMLVRQITFPLVSSSTRNSPVAPSA
jgi:hypothetical protein